MISEKLSIVDADTLLSTPLEKTLFIVEGLIPQGVTLLGGSSKIGKSWLMLRLGLQVARGLPLWGLKTTCCDVQICKVSFNGIIIADKCHSMLFRVLF